MQSGFWKWIFEQAQRQGFTVLLLLGGIFFFYHDRLQMQKSIDECRSKTDQLYELVIKNNTDVIEKNTEQLNDIQRTVRLYFNNTTEDDQIKKR